MELSDLSLTPTQFSEIGDLEPAFVASWLAALSAAGSQVKSPTGWFIAGIRSGRLPFEPTEAGRVTAVKKADRWMRTAGMFEPSEKDALDALFGHHGREPGGAEGILEEYDTPELREQMGALYRQQRVLGERTEQEAKERAERWKAAHEAAKMI